MIWEEPCTTYDENVSVAEETGCDIMLDQCVGDSELAIRAIDESVAKYVCIKPVPLGGLSIARKIRDHAIEAGMKVRIDGPWCGDIASAATLHLAAGTPEHLLICGCDLREPVAMPFNLNGVRSMGNNMIAPPQGSGLSITLTDNVPGTPERSFSAR